MSITLSPSRRMEGLRGGERVRVKERRSVPPSFLRPNFAPYLLPHSLSLSISPSLSYNIYIYIYLYGERVGGKERSD
jgi:hypothetical protein